MRDAITDLGGDTRRINPLYPTELVIDHSVIADVFGLPDAVRINASWSSSATPCATSCCGWAQQAFDDFSVVPGSSSARWCASTPPAEADYYRHSGIMQYVFAPIAGRAILTAIGLDDDISLIPRRPLHYVVKCTSRCRRQRIGVGPRPAHPQQHLRPAARAEHV